MKIYIVVTDVVNDVTYSHKSVNARVAKTFLLHDVIKWKSATSYDKLICLFELMLYVPVNSDGHVGTLPPFYGNFTQH